jgi:hypothetical protein
MEGTKEGVGGVTTLLTKAPVDEEKLANVGEGGGITVVVGGEDILRASGFGGTGGFGLVVTTGESLTGGVEEVRAG